MENLHIKLININISQNLGKSRPLLEGIASMKEFFAITVKLLGQLHINKITKTGFYRD